MYGSSVYIYKNINFTYLKFLYAIKKKLKIFRTFVKFILQFMYILNISLKNKYEVPIKNIYIHEIHLQKNILIPLTYFSAFYIVHSMFNGSKHFSIAVSNTHMVSWEGIQQIINTFSWKKNMHFYLCFLCIIKKPFGKKFCYKILFESNFHLISKWFLKYSVAFLYSP